MPCGAECRGHLISGPPGRFVVVERLRVCHAPGDALCYLLASHGFEHGIGDEAEGIDKLLAELLVVEQIEEDGDRLDLLGVVRHGFAVEAVEGVGLLVGKCVEGRIVPVEGIEVVEDEAEAAALVESRPPCLEVVLRPVVVADIELYGHVVAVFVDVEQRAYLVVGAFRGGAFRQGEQALHGIVGAALLA